MSLETARCVRCLELLCRSTAMGQDDSWWHVRSVYAKPALPYEGELVSPAMLTLDSRRRQAGHCAKRGSCHVYHPM